MFSNTFAMLTFVTLLLLLPPTAGIYLEQIKYQMLFKAFYMYQLI